MIRLRAALFVAILASAAIAHAQFTPTQNAPPTGDITLTGTVVNSVTGEPVPRALVQITGMQGGAVLADGSGKFQFQGLNEGEVYLMARKPGFFSDQELRRGARPVGVPVSSGMGSVAVSLTPAGVITGHITTTEGDPVEGAVVRLKRRMIENGRAEWRDQSGARTDEDGAFRMANLMPGAYYLFADGSTMGAPVAGESFTPAYYPGVNDISGATAIQVQPGQTTTADFNLQKEKTYRVTGTLTGIPVGRSAFIQVLSGGDENVRIAAGVHPDDNSFEIPRIAAGTYTLRAMSQPRPPFAFNGGGGGRRPARMPDRYIGSVQVNVNGNTSDVTIPLQPTADIPVSVSTEFTKPNSTSVTTYSGPPNAVRQYVNIMLHADNGRMYGAQMDENGSMIFRDVEPGRYRVEFNAIGGADYVASASFGNIDLLHDALVLASGGQQQPIEVVVRDDAPTLSGTANCGDVQCWILIVPEGNPALPARQVMVDRLGAFHPVPLAPGSCHVYAFDRVDGIEYTNPDAMKTYSSHAEDVVLTAGQSAQVSLELTKAVDQ